jgi:hypothetical protein
MSIQNALGDQLYSPAFSEESRSAIRVPTLNALEWCGFLERSCSRFTDLSERPFTLAHHPLTPRAFTFPGYLTLNYANFRRCWRPNFFLSNQLSNSIEPGYQTVAERVNRATEWVVENCEVEPLPKRILLM